MKKITNFIISLFILATVGGFGGSLLIAQSSFAAAPADKCNQGFLTFPAWYRGLTKDDGSATKCDLKQTTDIGAFIWHIVLNVIEIGLQLVGYAAAGLILFGGFKFLTSSGDSAAIVSAKKTITDAVIGLIISMASIAIINLIFSILP